MRPRAPGSTPAAALLELAVCHWLGCLLDLGVGQAAADQVLVGLAGSHHLAAQGGKGGRAGGPGGMPSGGGAGAAGGGEAGTAGGSGPKCCGSSRGMAGAPPRSGFGLGALLTSRLPTACGVCNPPGSIPAAPTRIPHSA